MDAAQITETDKALVWHPYTGFPPSMAPLVVTSAQGTRLTLADGREVVDGMSSWWAAIHGYRNPVLDKAARDQLDRMSHVMFGGLTHEPAVRLAELLVEITPPGLERVFLADSGSISVEVAIKMALQYWRAQGNNRKSRLLTWRGGYHGDTFMAMSVCDPEGGMHSLWTDVLPQQIFVPAPPRDYDQAYADLLETEITRQASDIAAVIVEPVVQGAGGMRFHDPRYLTDLRRICDANQVLLIFDEIATGFGRTGELFAANHAGISPDIMTVGKAITGGYLTLAAALCTPEIAATISAGHGALMHGPTFMGNPLASAVAVASIELLLSRDWKSDVETIEAALHEGLAGAPGEVRVRGAIGVIELDHPVDMAAATKAAVDAGVWLRPFRNLVYCMPPFVSSAEDLALICTGMHAAANAG